MVQTESIEDLYNELEQIEKWEKDQKGLWFWEKIGRIPFLVLDKLTPRFIHEKLNTALDEIGNYLQTGGEYLINEENVLKNFSKIDTEISEDLTLEQVTTLPISVMDKVSAHYAKSRSKFAAVQGATTGIGGIFTLSIDIPLLLGVSLKALQEIAICYGFNPHDKKERVFILKCLQFASSDIVGKKAILEQLSNFSQQEAAGKQAISQIQGWREVIFTYRDNFGWKKLFQMVPIAGIIFGAFINKSTLADITEAGIMLYKKRRILLKLEENKVK